jgi:hypothetical protein
VTFKVELKGAQEYEPYFADVPWFVYILINLNNGGAHQWDAIYMRGLWRFAKMI